MIKANGIHHIAIMAADIKSHIAFFSEVLGCKLSALFDMHGVPGGLHAFMHLDDGCYFSIVQLPQVKDIESTIGITHAGTGAGASAAGTMQHLAFKVDNEADLLNIRDRIRKFGVNVIGPIDHGMCKSIYFAGPDHLALEVACSDGELDQAQWVDPKVLERAGISADEASLYMAPDEYEGDGGGVAQPAYDASKPHMPYPEEIYQQMLQTADEVITAAASYAEPPVKKPQ